MKPLLRTRCGPASCRRLAAAQPTHEPLNALVAAGEAVVIVQLLALDQRLIRSRTLGFAKESRNIQRLIAGLNSEGREPKPIQNFWDRQPNLASGDYTENR